LPHRHRTARDGEDRDSALVGFQRDGQPVGGLIALANHDEF
jgi:hypothetical protein